MTLLRIKTYKLKNFKLSSMQWVGAIAGGLLLTAAFPPMGLAGCAWVALVPLLWAVRNVGPKKAFAMGFLAGLVHYLTLVHWLTVTMVSYGHLPVALSYLLLALLAVYLGLYIALFCGVGVWLAARSVWLVPGLAALWVVLEYLRTILFTGFPWALLGYSQHRSLYWIQIADVLGVYGVSFTLVLANLALFFCLLYIIKQNLQGHRVTGRDLAAVLSLAGIWLTGVWLYGHYRLIHLETEVRNAPVLSVAVVQGNIDQSLKWDGGYQEITIDKYVALSATTMQDQPDLIVWPETAAPFYMFYNHHLTRLLVNGLQPLGTHFLIGSPSFRYNKNDVDYFNTAYLLDPLGNEIGRYDKVHLVPYGEYVPLQRYMPFVGKMVEQVGDFKTGAIGQTLTWEGSRALGVLICYEVIFPVLARQTVRNGADVLINITNDAWFGRTGAPYQHFQMAVFRAVENRRSLARAANTGISGFIEPSGRIAGATELFADRVLTRRLPLLQTKTLYQRFGDWFAWFCVVLVAIFAVARVRKKSDYGKAF
jgi:apolipoprotein N-acyltransferase